MATDDSTPAPSISSLLGMDRRAMEAERLARRQKQKENQEQEKQEKQEKKEKQQELATEPKEPEKPTLTPTHRKKETTKRKADEAVVVLDDSDDDSAPAPPAQRRKLLSSASVAVSGTSTTASAMAAARPSLAYPEGVVKKTWLRGCPRADDDVTIDEVWQKNDLQLAVVSSFQWDEEWMLQHIDVRHTKLLLIAYAADENQKAEMRQNAPSSNVRFCFPPMTGPGAMHSKLQLLKYSTYLRIVVPTGNLVPYDWGDTGIIENMVFLIDLPRLSKDTAAGTGRTQFREDLAYFLKAQSVEESLVQSLDHYDFSATARYAFVHTIAGSHEKSAWQRTGYCGLGGAVKAMGWATDKPVQLDYLCSSIGAVNGDILNALYYACQGDSGKKEYEARVNRPRAGPNTIQSSRADWKNRVRVYFPSRTTVLQSRGGTSAAGTTCFRRNWWESAKFPQAILRDYENWRDGVLTHTKLLFARPEPGSQAWTYVGSANLSESAWGRMVKDRATKEPKLTCRNYECGVLVPAAVTETGRRVIEAEGPDMLDEFITTVPVPMVLPGTAYDSKDPSITPYFFLEN